MFFLNTFIFEGLPFKNKLVVYIYFKYLGIHSFSHSSEIAGIEINFVDRSVWSSKGFDDE